MSADAFRLLVAVVCGYLLVCSAPIVVAGGDWDEAIARSIMAVSVGVLLVSAFGAAAIAGFELYGLLKACYQKWVLSQ